MGEWASGQSADLLQVRTVRVSAGLRHVLFFYARDQVKSVYACLLCLCVCVSECQLDGGG